MHPLHLNCVLLDPSSGCASPLSIDGVAFGVGTWSTSRFLTVQVGQTVLDRYTGRPQFKCQDLVIAGETLQFYYCDIIPCIQTLYGDPEFARDLVFAPERHYTDHQRTCHVYSKMHTGDWWWSVQVRSRLLDVFQCLHLVIDIP